MCSSPTPSVTVEFENSMNTSHAFVASQRWIHMRKNGNTRVSFIQMKTYAKPLKQNFIYCLFCCCKQMAIMKNRIFCVECSNFPAALYMDPRACGCFAFNQLKHNENNEHCYCTNLQSECSSKTNKKQMKNRKGHEK